MVTIALLFVGVFLVAAAKANVVPAKANTLPLNDGTSIPVFGLGTWLNGGSNTEAQRAVEAAIAAGYRHIDTAAIYDTEKQVGLGLKAKIADGTVKRDDVYITTKLWNDKHRQEQVVPALRESLKNLGLDYVDLYLIHFPVSQDAYGKFDNVDFVETWKGMEEAKRLGLTKSIGVSNFKIADLQKLLKSASTVPAVNQIEVHPNLTQKPLIEYCKDHNIKVVAYTPLGSMPEPRSKGKNSPAPKIDDPILTEIGKKYGKNTVQVVLRYSIDRGLIPIPKSVKPSRIEQNIDIFDFKLTPDEISKIDAFNLDRSVGGP